LEGPPQVRPAQGSQTGFFRRSRRFAMLNLLEA
jgi:hypothetical protein